MSVPPGLRPAERDPSRSARLAAMRPQAVGRLPLAVAETDSLFGLLIQEVRGYAIFLLDLQGRVASWSAGAQEIKGYTEAEILGRHLSVFSPDGDPTGEADGHLRTAAREGRAEYEGWRVRKDGSRFWASMVITAINDSRGQLCGFGKVVQDLTDRHALEQESMRRSLHDPLTGLANRTLLTDRLEQALGRLHRRPACLAVLFVDLNDFKLVNDTFGHDRGDAVLADAASRLTGALRPDDTVARLGGDEFVAVCENLADAAEARDIVNRVLASFAPVTTLDGFEVSLSASVGAALTRQPDVPARVMLRRADRAMYVAKQQGGLDSRAHIERVSCPDVARTALPDLGLL